VDQRVASFWPKDVPWLNPTKEQVAAARADAERLRPFACDREGCEKRFVQKKELDMHVGVMHDRAQVFGKNALADDPGLEWQGKPHHVPPNRPPPGCEIGACTIHWSPVPDSCEICMHFMLKAQPDPPTSFFPSVRLRLREGMELGEGIEGPACLGDGGEEAMFKVKGTGATPCIAIIPVDGDQAMGAMGGVRSPRSGGSGGSGGMGKRAFRPVLVIALCRDKHNRNWLAYSPYLRLAELKAMGVTDLRKDFQEKYEVVLDTRITYLELTPDAVAQVGYVLQCSWNQFRRQLSNRELPKSNAVFFCRDGLELKAENKAGGEGFSEGGGGGRGFNVQAHDAWQWRRRERRRRRIRG
jgi:hypothetical protein